MPTLFSWKDSGGTIYPIAGRIRGVHTFTKGLCPKVKVIARLEYELVYCDTAVHRFNHYTTRTPPSKESAKQANCSLLPNCWPKRVMVADQNV